MNKTQHDSRAAAHGVLGDAKKSGGRSAFSLLHAVHGFGSQTAEKKTEGGYRHKHQPQNNRETIHPQKRGDKQQSHEEQMDDEPHGYVSFNVHPGTQIHVYLPRYDHPDRYGGEYNAVGRRRLPKIRHEQE